MQGGQRRGELTATRLDHQLIAAHGADLRGRHTHELRAFHHLDRVERLGGDDHAGLGFAEEQGVQAKLVPGGQIHLGPQQARGVTGDQLADGAFRQRHGQTAIAAIMRALHQAGLDQAQQRGVQGLRHGQVTARRGTGLLPVQHLQVSRTAEAENRVAFIRDGTEQDDGVALVLEPLRGDIFRLFNEADHSHGGRGVDGTVGILVVERAIAAGDGGVERAAAIGQAAHAFPDLPEELRLVRIRHVQIVRRAQRQRAAAREIAAGFGHGRLAAFIRVEIDVAAVAIHGHGHEFFGHGGIANFGGQFRTHHGKRIGLDADDGGVAAGQDDGTVAHLMIVLAINPVLGSDAGPREQLFQRADGLGGIGDAIQTEGADGLQISRLLRRALINGRFIGDLLRGDVRDNLAAVADDHVAGVRDDADLGPREVPLVKNAFHFLFATLVDHDEHALLRFREHDLVAGHVRRALRHLVQFDLDARARARGHFARGTGQARRAHVLHAGDRAGGEKFQAGFAHQLFHEGIAHLHCAALLLGGFIREILRGKGRACQAVAPSGRSDVEHRIAHALRRAARDLLMPQHAQAEGVHQRIALVGLVKIHFAGHRGDAEAIPVMGDATDHAAEEPAHLGIREFAEAERIDRADRPCAHGENVAHDAAHARGRALEGLDGTGMVVRLDLEGDGDAVAHIDDAGVLFTRAHENLRRLGGEGLEQRAGVLVAAMLAPHHGEDAEFGIARHAVAEDDLGIGVFVRREVVFGNQFRGDGGFAHFKKFNLDWLLIQTFHAQQVADLHAVVQLVPVNRVATGFE